MPEVNNSTINLLNKAYKDSSSGGSLRSLNWGRKDTGGGFSRKRQATGKKSRSYKSQTPDLKKTKTKKRNGRGNSGAGRNLKPVTKNAPPPAQNISQFGGGVKGNNAITFKGIAAIAGAGRAALPAVLGNGSFLAGVNSIPGLALVVGNVVLWKKNIEDLKKLYRLYNPSPVLQFPPTANVIEKGVVPFTGGQSPGVAYRLVFEMALVGNDGRTQSWIQPQYPSSFNSLVGPLSNVKLLANNVDVGALEHWSFRGYGQEPFLQAEEKIYSVSITSQGQTRSYYLMETYGVKILGFPRADQQTDTGGNPPPIKEEVSSSGGVSAAPPVAQPKEQAPPPLISPQTESKKLAKPLAIPAASPKVEPVPATIPKVELLPEIERDIQPTNPTESPPVKEVDITKPVEQKKPAKATVTTTRYASPQELEGIRKVIEEDRKKREFEVDKVEFEVDKVEFEVDKVEFEVDKTKKTLFRPTLPVIPTVERPATTDTNTGSGTSFPVIPPPVPGYKLQEPKAPAPTVTPVSSCQKGCAGAPVALNPTDSNNLARAADGASQLAILGYVKNTNEAVRHAKYGLEAVQKFGETAWKATHADKVLAVVHTSLLIHNAMMLSNNLFQTMGEATSMALNAVGIKDHEDNPIDVNTLVKNKITSILQSVLGVENYNALTVRIAKANRIYQASINLLDTTRSMFDSAQSIAEISTRYTGEIGNALRNAGVVAEDAYEEMIEKMNPQSKGLLGLQKFTDGVEAVETAFDSVTQISSNVVEIQDNIGQLETEKTALIAEIDQDKKDKETEREITKVNSTVTAEIGLADFEAAPPTEE